MKRKYIPGLLDVGQHFDQHKVWESGMPSLFMRIRRKSILMNAAVADDVSHPVQPGPSTSG